MSSLVNLNTFLASIQDHLTWGDGYCYGMYFSATVTQAMIDAKAAQYPAQYNAYVTHGGITKQVKVWAQDWIGKLAGDCVGMIKAAYWSDVDNHVTYRYLGRADVSANGMYNMAVNKGPLSTMPDTAGLCLHKNGHVGVYMGNGTVIEARGVAYGVVQTTLDLATLNSGGNPRGWLQWFEAPYIDYGTTAEEPEIPDIYPLNTLDEGLELGDMVPNALPVVADMTELGMVMLVSTSDDGVAVSGLYAGLPQQYQMIASTDPAEIRGQIGAYSAHMSSIMSIFLAPTAFIPTMDDTAAIINDYDVISEFYIDASSRPSTIDGYTPKNKKLLYYPYQYLLVHNADGGRRIYKYEQFNGAPRFAVFAAVIPGGVAKIRPVNILQGASTNIQDFDQALSISCFPECIWTSNDLKAWQSIHGASEALNNMGTIGAATGGVIAGLAMGNPMVVAGALGAGAMSIGQMLAKKSERELMGYSSHGAQSGNYTVTAAGHNAFILQVQSIKAQQAKRLDDYFEMYGYKCQELKIPDFTTRPYWNYLKTVDAAITGTLPESDKRKLALLFDSGITIWHKPDDFLDYTKNNHTESGV